MSGSVEFTQHNVDVRRVAVKQWGDGQEEEIIDLTAATVVKLLLFDAGSTTASRVLTAGASHSEGQSWIEVLDEDDLATGEVWAYNLAIHADADITETAQTLSYCIDVTWADAGPVTFPRGRTYPTITVLPKPAAPA